MAGAFLRQIAGSDHEKVHVVIGDESGFHNKQDEADNGKPPDSLHVLTLPPYSPELNPIEKLWEVMKNAIYYVSRECLEHLECRLTEILRPMWERVKGFSSLFTNSYLRSELDAS